MLQTRVIPVLLLRNNGLVKTFKFKKETYIGDPINAIKIFNDKEVDELILLDIDASKKGIEPNYSLIENIASECFMPVCYGGGINSIEQIRKIFSLGIEKISINITNLKSFELTQKAISEFGAQSIVTALDIKKNIFNQYKIYNHSKKRNEKIDLITYLTKINEIGVGELFINSVDNDGMQQGYDINLLQYINQYIDIPIIACGGASSIQDMAEVKRTTGINAFGAGSLFVFHGKHNAVLISYPKYEFLRKTFGE